MQGMRPQRNMKHRNEERHGEHATKMATTMAIITPRSGKRPAQQSAAISRSFEAT
jgi:hypothetical protein